MSIEKNIKNGLRKLLNEDHQFDMGDNGDEWAEKSASYAEALFGTDNGRGPQNAEDLVKAAIELYQKGGGNITSWDIAKVAAWRLELKPSNGSY